MKCKTGFKKVKGKCKKINKNIFSRTKKSLTFKNKIIFGRPDKWEVLSLILYGLAFYLFNDIVNIMSARGGYQITAGLISGLQIPLVPLMWTSFLTFHILLMIVIGRSIWKRDSTSKIIDLIIGVIILIGVFLLLIPTVLMLSGFGTDYVIPWFFNLGRTTVYHIGVLIQVLGMIYFAMTK